MSIKTEIEAKFIEIPADFRERLKAAGAVCAKEERVMRRRNFDTPDRQLLKKNGRIVISCPDGTHPALDMMFADHLYTFGARHLTQLVHAAGLVPLLWKACPKGGRLRHEQLIVAGLQGAPMPEAALPAWNNDVMLSARRDYLTAWSGLDAYFHHALGAMKNVYVFGAGEWGFLLSGYAPQTWKRITACTVDAHQGQFLGKEVIAYNSLKSQPVDAIILGTNPDSQPVLAERLSKDGFHVITWNHLVSR